MKPRVIKSPSQYEATLARIEEIFDAKPGTPKGDELELLLLLVETYENTACPIDLPDPISALRFRMEQDGLRPKDLIPFIGSKSKVSEVLSGQRPLSLTMIRKLVAGLGLPAEVALKAANRPSPRRIKQLTSNVDAVLLGPQIDQQEIQRRLNQGGGRPLADILHDR